MDNAIVPLLCTDKLEQTMTFYEQHIGFRATVEMPGYVELEQGAGGPRLGFMEPDGARWKVADPQGLVYCFRVSDADAEHARLAREGVTILEQPEDKPWGERGFLAADPNGLSLYFGHVLEATVGSGSGVASDDAGK